MEYRPPYQWFHQPPTHGISDPLPMLFCSPLPMAHRTHYLWYIEPHTNGTLNSLPMVY